MQRVVNVWRASRRAWRTWTLLAISYVPVLLARPGLVSADTKTYLYLDPAELLSEASSMWTKGVGAGTVTHQYIGYLWPMGPWFRAMDIARVPDWVAQRLWWGTIVFLAALGVQRLALRLRMPAGGALLAAVYYGLSPYALSYLARLSGLLLPWAGLPWIILFVVRARDERGWRWPAAAALVIGTVGTVNATTLFMALVALGLWLVAEVLSGEMRLRSAVALLARIGAGSIAVSMWWIVALLVQSSNGLPILRYTETYETVAKASFPHELLRGLGYWFFYGGEYGGRWVGPSAPYMQNRIVLVAGFAVAAAGIVAIAMNRGRHRIHLALLVLVGTGIAVGAAPLGSSSPWGRMFRGIVENESGFALRSTPRAMPGVLLALALAVGWGPGTVDGFLASLRGRWRLLLRRGGDIVRTALVAALVVNNLPWLTARMTTPAISRPESLPSYWTEAARAIDGAANEDGTSRTYEFPATNFANYWWGGTVDPILPGLISSGYVAREMIPQGSEATTDLLAAFESRLAEGRADLGVLGPLAAILSADTVTWRADLSYADYLSARPEIVAPLLDAVPPGRTLYTGPPTETLDHVDVLDETWFANTRAMTHPLVQVWRTGDARPILTTSRPERTVVLVGSGDGVVDALSAGALDSAESFVYSATLRLASTLADALPFLTRLVITDSNRKAATHWSSISAQQGRTERADESSTGDAGDTRLNPFTFDSAADIPVEEQSTTVLVGDVLDVRASSYGHPIIFTPEDRPENAIDGDPRTAWRGGVLADARGEWIEVRYRRDVTTGRVSLSMPTRGRTDRVVLSSHVEFLDASGTIVRSMDISPRRATRVVLDFPRTTFRSLRYVVDDDSMSGLTDFTNAPGVGVAEISIEGVESAEWVRVPEVTRALSAMADAVSIVLSRRAVDPTKRLDPEIDMHRIVPLARSREFDLSGTARLSGGAEDGAIQGALGIDVARASRRTIGAANAVGALAVDGRLDTTWSTPFDLSVGSVLSMRLAAPADSRRIRLAVVDDPFHSVPTRVTVGDSSGARGAVVLRKAGDGLLEGDLPANVRPPLVSMRIDAVESRTFPNYFSGVDQVLPVSVAEVDLGVPNDVVLPSVDADCRDDLVTVNGSPVPVRLVADGDPFASTTTIRLEGCTTVTLDAGDNRIATRTGLDSGFDVDSLVFEEHRTYGPDDAPVSEGWLKVDVDSFSDTRVVADVEMDGPRLLSFGESVNGGWRATLETATGTVDLGKPFVVQGYANGWVVPESGRVVLEWTPQRSIPRAIAFSLLSAFLLVAVLVRRRRGPAEPTPSGSPAPRWFLVASFILMAAILAGPVAAAAAVLALVAPRSRGIVAVVAGWTVITVVVVVLQTRYGYRASLDWPAHFAGLSPIAWATVAIAAVGSAARRP